MGEFGRKTLEIEVDDPLTALPARLQGRDLRLESEGQLLAYDYDRRAERTGIARLLADLAAEGITVRDLRTRQSSLEEIFLTLVSGPEEDRA